MCIPTVHPVPSPCLGLLRISHTHSMLQTDKTQIECCRIRLPHFAPCDSRTGGHNRPEGIYFSSGSGRVRSTPHCGSGLLGRPLIGPASARRWGNCAIYSATSLGERTAVSDISLIVGSQTVNDPGVTAGTERAQHRGKEVAGVLDARGDGGVCVCAQTIFLSWKGRGQRAGGVGGSESQGGGAKRPCPRPAVRWYKTGEA